MLEKKERIKKKREKKKKGGRIVVSAIILPPKEFWVKLPKVMMDGSLAREAIDLEMFPLAKLTW